MSLLDRLKKDEDVKTFDSDYTGTKLVDTDVYLSEILLAYLSTAKSGAVALNLELKTAVGKLKQTIYMTSGTAKGGLTTYKDKDGNKQFLPGYVMCSSVALLTVGKDIGEVDSEEKVINVYDYTAKKELPTKVEMLTELVGQTVKVAIERQLVDKQVKNDDGKYVNSGETREQNEIVKVFRERDDMTVTEITAQVEAAVYITKWTEDNQGKVKDKTKSVAGGAVAGAPPKAAGAAPLKSLFS